MQLRLFPDRLDNDYRGHPIALWAFYPITLITLVRSALHVFLPDGGAQSIATIPLDTMTTTGASAVILIFALWGLSQGLLGVLYVVALWRYRSLLPFLYLLWIIEYLARMGLGRWKPLVTLETAPGAIGNYIVVPLGLVMLFLSLRERRTSDVRSSVQKAREPGRETVS